MAQDCPLLGACAPRIHTGCYRCSVVVDYNPSGLSPPVRYRMALGVSLNLTVLLSGSQQAPAKLDGYITDVLEMMTIHRVEGITLFSPPSFHLNSEGSHLLLTSIR